MSKETDAPMFEEVNRQIVSAISRDGVAYVCKSWISAFDSPTSLIMLLLERGYSVRGKYDIINQETPVLIGADVRL